MIIIENINTSNWECAIRGMRNPMNSWDKSDSYPAVDCTKCGKIEKTGICRKEDRDCTGYEVFAIGPNDLNLMKRLRNGGSDDRKFMRQIFVSIDITAPLYWWKEADQYKVGTTTNSCSTMHKIHSKEFELSDFSWEYLTPINIESLRETIYTLNEYRDFYNNWDGFDENTKNAWHLTERKDAWWQMIQLLPSSYNQRRTWTGNYENLARIYHARKNHKLDEWHDFCNVIMTLPYAEELIKGDMEHKPMHDGLYECDPEKNKTCPKKYCHINGGECHCTTKEEFRK